MSEYVTIVNCFHVPHGRDEEFLSLWTEVNTHMAGQDGYLGHRLHRSLQPGSHFQYVNLAWWDSPQAVQAAHDDHFRALVGQPAWADFTSTPTLTEPTHAGGLIPDAAATH